MSELQRTAPRIARPIVGLTFVGLVVVIGACSSSSASPGSGPSASQACADSAHARCIQQQTCSNDNLIEVYGTEATCETRVAETCNSALAAPQNANTPSNVEACVAQIAGWSCNDFLVDANPPSACAQVLGPLANGSPCEAAGQCQSGFCAYSTSPCGTCAAAPTAGQPCTGAHQCAPGFECNAQTVACVAPTAAGGACGGTTGAVCAPGTRCVKAACTALTATVAAGQPCGDVSGAATGCTAGTCEASGQGQATCVARAADGAACNLTTGPFCEPPALCIGGTCQAPACH